MSNDYCSVVDPFVRDGFVIIKAKGDGIVAGGADDEDDVACEIDVDNAGVNDGR